jgi:death on curing protein
MKWVSVDSVIEIHKMVINSTGGSQGVRSLDALESALNSPLATFDGTDLYPNIVGKAAMLLNSITNNHPFIDGNKRTAFVVTVTILEDNDYKTQFTQEEVVSFMLHIAQGNVNQTEIKQWLEEHFL